MARTCRFENSLVSQSCRRRDSAANAAGSVAGAIARACGGLKGLIASVPSAASEVNTARSSIPMFRAGCLCRGCPGLGGGETDPNDLVNVSSSSALGRLRPGMFPGRFWRDTGTRFEEGDALAGFAQIYHGGREASGGPCADKSISRSVLNDREVRSYKEKAPPPPPPPTDEALKNVKHLPTL